MCSSWEETLAVFVIVQLLLVDIYKKPKFLNNALK